MASPWLARRARSLVLAAIGMVLAGTVASYFYRRGEPPAPLPGPAAIAEDVGQQTQSFSLSKTVGDHTLYTITAEQVTNYQDSGRALLRNVAVQIFGKDGSRQDRITSPESYYDPAASSVWIPGEVEMLFGLPAPQAATKETADRTGEAIGAKSVIPLAMHTSQLAFTQSTGVAATKELVQFAFPLGQGSARGAAYDPEKQVLTLQSQVRFELGERPVAGSRSSGAGTSPSAPDEKTLLRAGTVHFIRPTGQAILEDSIEIARGPQRIVAARGEMQLDEGLRVQRVLLAGSVVATEATSAESRRARAERAEIELDSSGRMQSLVLDGDVFWSLQALPLGARREGSAGHVEMRFRPSDGLLDGIAAERDVRMSFSGGTGQAAGAASRKLSGGRAQVMMAPDGRTMREVMMESSPLLELPGGVDSEHHTVAARRFQIGLNARGELSEFQAQGNVRVVSEANTPPGSRRETRSDSLEAWFHPGGSGEASLERIRQWGGFEYSDAQRQASSIEASYEAAAGIITLTGDPVVWNTEGRLAAARIKLQTRSGVLEADGDVASTLLGPSSAGGTNSEPLHVTADRMRYEPAERRSRFAGNTKMWQGESFLVEAASLEWSSHAAELTASREVQSIFRPSPNGNGAGASAGAGAGTSASKPRPDLSTITIAADSLRYHQPERRMRYEGGVRLRSRSGELTASMLEIFLRQPTAQTSADFSLDAGRIERVVAQQEVTIREGSREAAGERAEFYPDSERVRLVGGPATVTDSERGRVQGAELTYILGDDSIQVQGSPDSPTETRWLVRP